MKKSLNKRTITVFFWIISSILVLTLLYFTIGCPFRFLFGICCPGCGMTRAAISILHFDFVAAFYNHPMIYLMPFFLLALILQKYIPQKHKKIILGFFIVLMLSVYFIRLFIGSEIVYINLDKGYLFQLLKNIKNN